MVSSNLVKMAVIYFMIGICFKLLIPEAGIGAALTKKFVIVNDTAIDVAETLNETLPKQPTGVLSDVFGFIAPIQMVWNFIAFVIDLVTMPIGIAQYMMSLGAPSEVVLAAISPFIVLTVGAVIDFIRTGG